MRDIKKKKGKVRLSNKINNSTNTHIFIDFDYTTC